VIAPAGSLGEGRHTFTVTAADDEGQVSAPSPALSVRIDRQSPSIKLADTSPRAIVLKFSENVRKSLALDDLRLVNTTTGRTISRGTMDLVYNDLSNTATVTFPGLSGKILPAAWYALTVTNSDISDVAGNSMQSASRFEFTTAPGISGSGSSKTLNLRGTRGNDRMTLSLKRGDAGILQVSINDRIANYSMRLFSRLHIQSLAGDDAISFDFANGAFKLPAEIFGGVGNDTIQGGLGNDRIFAGAGDDVVSGGAGNDTIYGQAGNDLLSGETGNDYLNGGLGRDFLVGNKGSDRIVHDSQDDAQSDGNDTTITG
jgi:Ca2+-binding RTX toxin-like protein